MQSSRQYKCEKKKQKMISLQTKSKPNIVMRNETMSVSYTKQGPDKGIDVKVSGRRKGGSAKYIRAEADAYTEQLLLKNIAR